MEKALAAIHQTLKPQQSFSLAFVSAGRDIELRVASSDSLASLITDPITANYPQCVLKEATTEYVTLPTNSTWTTELRLVPELFPILRHGQFEDALNRNFADPITGILRAIRPTNGEHCAIEIQIAPATSARQRRAIARIHNLARPFFVTHPRLSAFYATHSGCTWRGLIAALIGFAAWRSGGVTPSSALSTSTSRTHEREADLQAASDKVGGHLFEVRIQLSVGGPLLSPQQAHDRLRAMIGAFGVFTKSRLANFKATRIERGSRPSSTNSGFILSHEELATLWHPPTATALAEQMPTTAFTELEAPQGERFHSGEEEGAITLGRIRFRDDRRLIGLGPEDRRRHLYIVGKTGMGKSTLLQNMIVADMRGRSMGFHPVPSLQTQVARKHMSECTDWKSMQLENAHRGLCLIDPHGDLAANITTMIPKHRKNDVIVFDAADRDRVVPFNPLACRNPDLIDQVTSGVVSAFKKLHDSWGPRLEDTLRNAVFATVEQGGNLVSLLRLLAEPAYRDQVVCRINDEVVRSFWQHEFASWSNNYRTEAVAAIQNKIRPFLTSRTLRAIVSHEHRSIDLRDIMDRGRILIVNLSKGRVGEDNATLLGAFLVTAIQQAALTRADMPEDQRRDFILYVDEFQNFTTGSFATILSEARKYRLSLVIAHQYLQQLDEPTASAVFGNVGSMISFQVGSDDAQVLATQLAKHDGQITQQDLTNLPKYTAYARLLINGLPSNPFSMQTLPPLTTPESKQSVCQKGNSVALSHSDGQSPSRTGS